MSLNDTNDVGLVIQKPGRIHLLRADKNDPWSSKNNWQWFTGTASNPSWGSRTNSKPVFQDPRGVGWGLSVSFNPGIGRYLLMTEHSNNTLGGASNGKSMQSRLGIFDAPEPWGPWTTVNYYDNWANQRSGDGGPFFWNFSNKWLRNNGKDFTIVFTGGLGQPFDRWHSMNGSFQVPAASPPPPPPPPPAPPPPPPPPPSGQRLLSHTIHSADGGGHDMKDVLLNNPTFVHDGDVIDIIAGNNTRLLTQSAMNNVNNIGTQLKNKYGNRIHLILATAGLVNVQFAATRLNSAFEGVSFVYEPQYRDFPDGDNSTSGPNYFSPANTSQFNNYSRNLAEDCQAALDPQGLDFTWGVTGRLITNEGRVVVSNYGFLASLGEGNTNQTQRFLAGSLNEFRNAVDTVVSQYEANNVLHHRTLACRITVGPQTQHNGVTANLAIQGANYCWGKNGVTMPSLFPAYSEMPEVIRFYQLREQ